MIILTIRTDKPEAEVSVYTDAGLIGRETWHAHRELAETLHTHIRGVLQRHALYIENIEGIVCFKGPGSFTGLRIGVSVANALSYGLGVPLVGTMGEGWEATGVQALRDGTSEPAVLPEYGTPPHITEQKH